MEIYFYSHEYWGLQRLVRGCFLVLDSCLFLSPTRQEQQGSSWASFIRM